MSTTPHEVPRLLEVDGICKYYGNIVALKDITTQVNAGEVTCVLGDNGAGKSSFIKILSGAHAPDEGACSWTASRCSSTRRATRARSGSRPSTRISRWCRSCRSGGTSSSARSR